MKQAVLIFFLAIITYKLNAQPAAGTIEGYIVTQDGNYIEEAHIAIKELQQFTSSNNNGYFVFKQLPFGTYILQYSFAGFRKQETTITVNSSFKKVRLVLHTDHMKEVFVTGTRHTIITKASATKTDIPIEDLPQSIQVIEERVLEDQQVQRLSDVVKNTNGVSLGSMRAGTQETFYARGYNMSNTNIFKNGSLINSGAITEMSGLERVEILKGSAAILYGNVSPGGVINMITKKPKFEQGGAVSMRAGSFDMYKPAIDFYGPLTKNIAYRLNSSYENANSFRDVVSSKKFYINPSLLFKINRRSYLLIQAEYLQHHFTPDFGIGTLADSVIADVPHSRFMGAPWQYAHTRQSTASIIYNNNLGSNWNFSLKSAWQGYSRDYFSLERIQAKANGDWIRPLGKTFNRQQYYMAQADVTGIFYTKNIQHNILLGADADRDYTTLFTSNLERKTYDTINLLEPEKYDIRTDVPQAAWEKKQQTPVFKTGIYLQDLISFSEKLKLLAGLRYSYLQTNPIAVTYLLKNDSVSFSNIQIDRAFSPKVGLVYKPLSGLSVFASYTKSFIPNSGTDIYYNALPPSYINQYEAGIKTTLLHDKLFTNITLYRIINSNLVQTALLAADGKPNSNTNIKELTGETTSDGLEVDIRAYPIYGLDMIAGYSYNFIRYTKDGAAGNTYVTGQRLVNSPAHTANATAFYTITQGSLKHLKIGAGVYYVGERYGGWNYTNSNKRPLFLVKPFTTIDVSAGYQLQRLELMVKLSNVGNTLNYYVHENYSINPIPPRNVVATLTYRF